MESEDSPFRTPMEKLLNNGYTQNTIFMPFSPRHQTPLSKKRRATLKVESHAHKLKKLVSLHYQIPQAPILDNNFLRIKMLELHSNIRVHELLITNWS